MKRAIALAGLCAAIAAGAGGAAGVPRWTHWLCFPNKPQDWCYVALPTTVISADGSRKVVNVPTDSRPPVDCFYLYPTVSEEHRGNSDLTVQPAERNVAIIEAARFSQVCRVFAPMYRQVTAYGNGNPYKGSYADEYADIRAAWHDYLAHDNLGRGVVLIGHSEGAFLLKELIANEIERSPSERKLLVSAILLGGDVRVAHGSTTGGDFKRIPACTSASELGCVVAYSSWGHTPPKDANFESAPANEDVLCVNPAAPGSSAAVPITPIFAGFSPQGMAPSIFVWLKLPWVEFPDLYTARCVRQGSRAWLLVERIHHPGDERPTVQEVLPPSWGLHAADMLVAMANLVTLVSSESRAWLAHR